MSSQPDPLPPSFAYPAKDAPWAEFEAAVFSDHLALRAAVLERRARGQPLATGAGTEAGLDLSVECVTEAEEVNTISFIEE